MRRALATLLLLTLSLGVCLALGEGLLRALLDEVDLLRPTLRPHPLLGHEIVPGSGGHDAWGFRNRSVPERASVVAIGDSQTYGVSAPAREAYPAWLARLSGQEVYNLGVGGYGPFEYRVLLRGPGLRLAPRTALIGVYLGNDLYPTWDREEGGPGNAVALGSAGADGRLLGGTRDWLSRHGVLYQAVKLQLFSLLDRVRVWEGESATRARWIHLEHPLARTTLDPERRLRVIDQGDPANRRSLEVVLEILGDTHATCREQAVACLFLLIPTKESVHWPLAREVVEDDDRRRLETLVDQEALVRQRMKAFFRERGIPCLDLLPPLRAALESGPLYPPSDDGHPTGAGYRAIAEAILASPEWAAASGRGRSSER